MESQIVSAVTTDEETSVTTNEVDEDVVLAEDDGKEVESEFTDEETESQTEEVDEEGKKEKPKQSKEKNKEYAEKRRLEKASKEEAELNFVKEYVGKNPYTGEEIETLRDVKVYKTMKQIEKNGGDPIQDYHKYAGLEEQKAIDSEKVRKENIKKDVEGFKKAYPNIDLNELSKDKDFVEFSDKLLGKVSLVDVYEAYEGVRSKLKVTAEESAKKEVARKMAKENTSVGSLATIGDANAPMYTMEQLANMSKSEISKDWKNVEASYDYWQKNKK